MKRQANAAAATGWRETGDDEGRVIHMRVGVSILCLTRGNNRHASTDAKAVNCKKCAERIKAIRG